MATACYECKEKFDEYTIEYEDTGLCHYCYVDSIDPKWEEFNQDYEEPYRC